MTAIEDPVLDGALRMVKRGSEEIVDSVYIGGELAFHGGAASSVLGRERLGEVIRQEPLEQSETPARNLRNRISDELVDHPFSDYWEIFVLKHQHPANIALHCLGVIIFYGLLAASWILGNPWLLLLLPLSQLVGLVGHLCFERNYIDSRDAVFSVRASMALNRLFVRVLSGNYGRDLEEMRRRLKAYQSLKTGVPHENVLVPV